MTIHLSAVRSETRCLVCRIDLTANTDLVTCDAGFYNRRHDRCDGRPAGAVRAVRADQSRIESEAKEFVRRLEWPSNEPAPCSLTDEEIVTLQRDGWGSDSRALTLRLFATIERVQREGEERREQTRSDLTGAILALGKLDDQIGADSVARSERLTWAKACEECVQLCRECADLPNTTPGERSIALTIAAKIHALGAHVRPVSMPSASETVERWGVYCAPTAPTFDGKGSWMKWSDPPRDWTGSKAEAEGEAKLLQERYPKLHGLNHKYEARPYPPPEAGR